MKQFKKSILAGLGLASITLLAACGSSSSTEGSVIRVGTMPLTVGVPIQFAYDHGFFSDEGLDVDITIFSTGAPINEAFAAGEIDIAASGLASVFSLANADARWVGEINTTGGMGIFVRPDSEIAQLSGQVGGFPDILGSRDTVEGLSILGPLGTVSQFNIIGFANRFGLDSGNVTQIHMEHGSAFSAFIAGEGDAIAINPPFSFQLKDAGYVLAASFEDATGVSLMDGIFTTANFTENREEELTKFLRAVYRAIDELQDFDTRFDFSIEWFADNGLDVDPAFLTSEIEVRQYVTGQMMQEPDFLFGQGMNAIAEFFTEDERIEEANLPNVRNSFAPSFLEEALGISVNVDR